MGGLLTEVTKVEEKLFGIAKRYSRKHSFRVNGYRSGRDALLKNIDRLTSDSRIERVKEAIDNYEHCREVFIELLESDLAAYGERFAKNRLAQEPAASVAYSTSPHRPTNVERVFGLDFEGRLRRTLRDGIESKRAAFYQKQSSA